MRYYKTRSFKSPRQHVMEHAQCEMMVILATYALLNVIKLVCMCESALRLPFF